MKKRPINFKTLEDFKDVPQLLFIRPLLCKTVRVFKIPDNFRASGHYFAIEDILHQTASFVKDGIWYYIPSDEHRLHVAMLYLTETLEIEYFLADEGLQHGRDENNQPIAEILN